MSNINNHQTKERFSRYLTIFFGNSDKFHEQFPLKIHFEDCQMLSLLRIVHDYLHTLYDHGENYNTAQRHH